MLIFFVCLLISIIMSYGMAILLVDKGNEWPIKSYRVRLQLVIRKIHYKAPQALYCETCSSFWLSLIGDLVVFFVSCCFGTPYFFWPFSGFITAGFTWTVMELLDSLEKEQKINLIIGDNSDKGE